MDVFAASVAPYENATVCVGNVIVAIHVEEADIRDRTIACFRQQQPSYATDLAWVMRYEPDRLP